MAHQRSHASSTRCLAAKVVTCSVELADGLASCALVLADQAHDLLQLLVEALETVVDALLLLLGKSIVGLARHGLALRGLGGEGQSRGVRTMVKLLGLGLLAQAA